MNRAQRRILQAKAEILAATLVSCMFDFKGGTLVRVTDPAALGALRRALTRMLKAGGQPVALPISSREAEGFPRYKALQIPGGKTWLAVGLDRDGRGSYALHSVWAENGAAAHEVARMLALARLKKLTMTKGFCCGD